MAESSIPVDLLNPGQVFACLGLLEAADILLGAASAAFDWSDGRETRFRVAAEAEEPPVERVMRFLEKAEVIARAPSQSPNVERWNPDWGKLERPDADRPAIPEDGRDDAAALAQVEEPDADRSAARPRRGRPISRPEHSFPFPDPDSPATLPVLLRDDDGNEIALDYWGDATRRDNVKFWAGLRGKPGAAIVRDALEAVRGKTRQHATDPFALSSPQSNSFRFDWRRDYIPAQDGFSPNNHKNSVVEIQMVGFPLVETLAAIGVTNARPHRETRLEYRYGVLGAGHGPLLDPMFHRAALGAETSPVPGRPFRRFVMHLDEPGQAGQARCITQVTEVVPQFDSGTVMSR